MTRHWTLIKEYYCHIANEAQACGVTRNSKEKGPDCSDCELYLAWVKMGRPKPPFNPDAYEINEILRGNRNDNEVQRKGVPINELPHKDGEHSG